MDEEERHVEVQRQGSAAGLLAAVFLIFLTGAALLVGITFWPAVKSSPPPPTSIQGPVSSKGRLKIHTINPQTLT
jgi:hypothetical protein